MAFLQSFGKYLPERVVTNPELAERFQCEPEWILSSSGITERRYAAHDETVVSMGVQAARACLEGNREPVGLLICSCSTAGRRFPGPAATIAHQLGLTGIPALDLPVASAGSLFALSLALRLAPTYGVILIVATEKMSGLTDDRNTAILFGDGAAACLVLHRSEYRLRLVDSVLHSDGTYTDDLTLPLNAPLAMNGRQVILQATRKMPAAIEELLMRNALTPAQVQTYILHQANQNLIDRVAKALAAPLERFPSNIARYGNTSSASMLIAATEFLKDTRGPVVFCAFGAGFHWGAVLATNVL